MIIKQTLFLAIYFDRLMAVMRTKTLSRRELITLLENDDVQLLGVTPYVEEVDEIL